MSADDLANFLKHNVEDYLLEDLETLKAAIAPVGKGGGAVGYPLLVTTFSGIELLGNLVSSSQFNPFEGKDRFVEFWKAYMYPADAARAAAGTELYAIARNGLAHAFVVKGNFEVWKSNPQYHLVKRTSGVVAIDAVQLADDFRAAYEKGVKPHVGANDGLAMTMRTRLSEMKAKYDSQAKSAIQKLVLPQAQASAPALGPTGPANTVLFSSSSQPIGPSGPSFGPMTIKSTP